MDIGDYERLCLSAAMNDKSAVYRLAAELPEVNFHYGPGNELSQAHRHIYRAILALHQDGCAVDTATVAARLDGNLPRSGGEAYPIDCQVSPVAA